MPVRRATLRGGIAIVVFVAGWALLWIGWTGAALPSQAEIERLRASGETSAIINGWEILVHPGVPELVSSDTNRSFVEAYVMRPVPPMAELRSRLGAVPRR